MKMPDPAPIRHNFKDGKLAGTVAGSTPTPGEEYEAVWYSVAGYPDGIFEARASYGSGFCDENGNLRESRNHYARVFTTDIDAGMRDVLETSLRWDCKSITEEGRIAAVSTAVVFAKNRMSAALSPAARLYKLKQIVDDMERKFANDKPQQE
jgi:hypothetical protein